MTELSQEEKDRIKADLIYRKTICNETCFPTAAWKQLVELLAHPVIVTVLGGMLLACIGAYLQDHYAHRQALSAHAIQLNDKKVAIVANLPLLLHRDLSLLVNRSYLRCDLECWVHEPSHIGYLGRSRKEAMELYSKLVEEYIKAPRQAALLSEVQAWFRQPNVIAQAQKLEEKIEKFENMDASELTEEKVKNFDHESIEMIKSLIFAMRDEVNLPLQRPLEK